MAICPAGHQSSSDDYCDICGVPIAPEQQAASAQVGPATLPGDTAPRSGGAQCPNCGILNAPDALFCEACGYDFTTGTLPRSATSSDDPEPDQEAEFVAEGAPVEPAEPAPAEPQRVEQNAAEPVELAGAPAEPAADQADASPVASNGSASDPSAMDEAAAAPVEPWEAPAAPNPTPAPGAGSRLLHPQPTSVGWVAEVWIDPDWYATQGSTDALPSPSLPDVVPLRSTSALIGRVSVSRNIHPDIDCDPDTGVSRRHAQISTDGTRWWVEDLESANGTFVGSAAGPLPGMPIGRGRVEFALDQRIYVGGWTRVVIREATDDEQRAYAG